jgi:hypothetical protein
LAVIVGRGKLLRDAVVHASPVLETDSAESGKEALLFNPSLEDATAVADAALGLVRKIELAVAGHDRRLNWLRPRGPDGRFPDAVFE